MPSAPNPASPPLPAAVATSMRSFSCCCSCSWASRSSDVCTWDAHLMRSNSSGLMIRDSPEGSLVGTLARRKQGQVKRDPRGKESTVLSTAFQLC